LWEKFHSLLESAGLPSDRRHCFHCVRKSAESYAAVRCGVEQAAAMVGHGVGIARASYIDPRICPPMSLVDHLPRP
jgi:hypothetical protein